MLKLLDLFSGAGGSAMGYYQAGFRDITGVDIAPQLHYPFTFVQGDAMSYLAAHGHEYDVIHASPPCQGYSTMRGLVTGSYPLLIDAVRVLLQRSGRPYVIENVSGAPLRAPITLCGSMFGLQTPCGAQLRRHRLFECSVPLTAPAPCRHRRERTISICGHGYFNEQERMRVRTLGGKGVYEVFSAADARLAMGIDWMSRDELSQAVPPAYTRYIGLQLHSCTNV